MCVCELIKKPLDLTTIMICPFQPLFLYLKKKRMLACRYRCSSHCSMSWPTQPMTYSNKPTPIHTSIDCLWGQWRWRSNSFYYVTCLFVAQIKYFFQYSPACTNNNKGNCQHYLVTTAFVANTCIRALVCLCSFWALLGEKKPVILHLPAWYNY